MEYKFGSVNYRFLYFPRNTRQKLLHSIYRNSDIFLLAHD